MNKPLVAILMSTYNGEKYLVEQINSILKQSYDNFHLFIRDDASTDSTPKMLKQFENDSKVTICFSQHNLGYKNSFLHLLRLVTSYEKKFDFYSFSDQDDFWSNDKIKMGIEKLISCNHQKYVVYFTGLTFVDENLNFLKNKDESKTITTFGGEMVRHSVSGATTILSRPLAELAVKFDEVYKLPGGHDAFIFRLNSAIGGNFIKDSRSFIKFRRHSDNVSSATKGFCYRISRELKTDEQIVYSTAKLIKEKYYNYVTNDNKVLLNQLLKYDTSLFSKVKLIRNKKFRREHVIMNIIFFFRVLMNRV